MMNSSCFIGVLCLLIGLLPAAPTLSVTTKPLVVVMKPVQPFVFEKNGKYVGYSVDLWDRIAKEANLDYRTVVVGSVPEAMQALIDNKADVAVGALSITAERESVVDFSFPFYRSGLQILVQAKGKTTLWATLKGLLRPDVLGFMGFLVGALILNSFLLWLLERKRNGEVFPPKVQGGMGQSLWWSICTIITGGCENVAPIGFWGRVLAVVWMLAGVALFTTVQGLITSTMTVNTLTTEVRSIYDLKTQAVATVGGSTAERFLKEAGIEPINFTKVEEAVDALAAGKVKAVIYDAPILRYLISQRPPESFQLVGDLLEKQNYGIGLRENSPHRRQINQILLKLAEDGLYEELERKWFGSAASN